VPVEVGLELRAIVCLYYEHSEGQSPDDLINEANRRLLVWPVLSRWGTHDSRDITSTKRE
jgi:hypothetical protein